MKRTKLVLKRRLGLVRTTIRELTPAQLEKANGGDAEMITFWCTLVSCTCWNCPCDNPYTVQAS